MNRIILVFFSIFMVTALNGQEKISISKKEVDGRGQFQNDTLRNRLNNRSGNIVKNENATIDLYKIISVENDTTIVDTTLTVYKDYKYNYLRKDYFDLLPFNNIGQTYNSLSYDFRSNNLMPFFGSRARHFNFMEIEDKTQFMNCSTVLLSFYPIILMFDMNCR